MTKRLRAEEHRPHFDAALGRSTALALAPHINAAIILVVAVGHASVAAMAVALAIVMAVNRSARRFQYLHPAIIAPVAVTGLFADLIHIVVAGVGMAAIHQLNQRTARRHMVCRIDGGRKGHALQTKR